MTTQMLVLISPALVFRTNDNIELKSFTDVANDERIDSKAMEGKLKSEVEESSPLLNCQFFPLKILLR